MDRLLKLAQFLRDPQKGCPWDRDQNFDTFKKCLLNEAQEAALAIDNKDFANLREELGDTLFNIVFLINLAQEQGLFTKNEVIEAVFFKILERHPHVFGTDKAENASQALGLFQKVKQAGKDKQLTTIPPLTVTRENAWQLLCTYTAGESLRRHGLAVEAAMAACAAKFGSNGEEEKWRGVGLLHDLDYEKFPDFHPFTAAYILRERGYPQDMQRAILCHVEERTGFAPVSLMEKSLCAVDELCGFIVAVALVRPSKKIADVNCEAVIKKMKDKAFARTVDRSAIRHGATLVGMSLDELITLVLDALTTWEAKSIPS